MDKRIAIMAVVAVLGAAGCCMGGGSSAAPISLGPGFAPDPTTATGSAGGITQASTLSPDCVGNISLIPNHTVTVTGPIPLLRVIVNSSADTTLAIRTPNGQVLCNDDSGDPQHSLNPAVDIANAAAGNYEIYVGSYSDASQLASYRIGFTANAQAFGSSIPAP